MQQHLNGIPVRGPPPRQRSPPQVMLRKASTQYPMLTAQGMDIKPQSWVSVNSNMGQKSKGPYLNGIGPFFLTH